MADGGIPRNRISVVIEYIPSGNGSVNYSDTSATLSGQGNDISNPQALNTAHTGGIKPFIWGVSKIGSIEEGGDGHHFWSDPTGDPMIVDGRQVGGKYNGFWGLEASDENGEFDSPVTFQIIGQDINRFVIRFDQSLGEYASVVNVDGIDYENTGEFVWSGVESNTHYVTIKKWNKPNKQVKITSVLIGLVIEYDNKYFQRGGKVVAGSRQTLDNTKPFYGVAPQYGSFHTVDIDGNINELDQVGLLIDGLRCGVFMNAEPFVTGGNYDDYKMANNEKMLGDYRLAEVGFIGNEISSELNDDILSWGATYQDGIEDDPNNTGYTIFEKLQAVITPNTIKMDSEIIKYLKAFSFLDGYIPPSMIDVAFGILCWAILTRINKDTGGNIRINK